MLQLSGRHPALCAVLTALVLGLGAAQFGVTLPATRNAPGVLHCVLFATVGCSDDVARYFPAHAGWRWHYGTERAGLAASHGERFDVTGLGDRELRGQRVTLRRYSDRSTAVYRHTPRGIVHSGHLRPDGSWQLERATLLLPRQPHVGAVWATSSAASTMHRRMLIASGTQPPETVVEPHVATPMTARVVSTAARVTVPAGTFDDCLHVFARGRARMATRSDLGIETEDWYAPGIGLVKSVRRESADSDPGAGAQISFELLRVER